MPKPKKSPDLPPDELRLEPDEEKSSRARGVYIPLTPDGQLDSARIKNVAKFEEARRALGTIPPSEQPYLKPASITVDPNFVRGLYRGIEVSLQWVGTRLLKWPHDLASEMCYTDEQKDRLIPPTKELIEKLAPAWLIKHQEIATLAVIFAAETQSMVDRALKGYIAKHPELTQPQPVPAKPNGQATEDHIAGDALTAAA